jgi:hypothetical protein
MLRVYVDHNLMREDASVEVNSPIRVDEGSVVCGVAIPEGRKVRHHRIKRGKRVLRVDLYTEKV